MSTKEIVLQDMGITESEYEYYIKLVRLTEDSLDFQDDKRFKATLGKLRDLGLHGELVDRIEKAYTNYTELIDEYNKEDDKLTFSSYIDGDRSVIQERLHALDSDIFHYEGELEFDSIVKTLSEGFKVVENKKGTVYLVVDKRDYYHQDENQLQLF